MNQYKTIVKVNLFNNGTGGMIEVGEGVTQSHIILSDQEFLLIADRLQELRPQIEERINNRRKKS